jgi:hypothetical protein
MKINRGKNKSEIPTYTMIETVQENPFYDQANKLQS